MPPPTANEIKTQLKTLFTPVIGTSLTKKVKIFDYQALAFKPPEGEDPTILMSPLDPVVLQSGITSNRVNCLMIGELGFGQTKVPVKEDQTRLITQPRGKNIITRQFFLDYFYQFGSNSENVFSANVELMRTTVNDNPKLGFTVGGVPTGAGEWVEGHDMLQVPTGQMYVDHFGNRACHLAQMALTVRLIEGLG